MVITLSHGVHNHGLEKIDTRLGQKKKVGPLGKTLVSLWNAKTGKGRGGNLKLAKTIAVTATSPVIGRSAGTVAGRDPKLRQSSKGSDLKRGLRGRNGDKDLPDNSSFLLHLMMKIG
ncbi:hypothetical protein AT2G05915 [Arabidopsis thaliana]|nr:uncharacterized protein AT2G05915 [Arabidopsis thaliana]AEC05984.1 hypothetical protein AT2G05915 [Arabidopsis thaliana]|eukprot:NP_671783.1 hypothetical protein AT2G05915 [Arabidopsis thaliana]